MSKECPKCGYGIMEAVVVVDVTGGWEFEGEHLKASQKQRRVWRCIDCLYEQEVGNDKASSGD